MPFEVNCEVHQKAAGLSPRSSSRSKTLFFTSSSFSSSSSCGAFFSLEVGSPNSYLYEYSRDSLSEELYRRASEPSRSFNHEFCRLPLDFLPLILPSIRSNMYFSPRSMYPRYCILRHFMVTRSSASFLILRSTSTFAIY